MPIPKVTEKEMGATVKYWRQHLDALQKNDLVKPDVISFVSEATQADNIGYDSGQIRPGNMGQWDIYDLLLEFGCSEEERLLTSGLTADEVAEEERREKLRSRCVNPDDPRAVADYERLEAMSPEELNEEIAHLEDKLGLEPTRT